MKIPFSAAEIAELCLKGKLSPIQVVEETFKRIEEAESSVGAFLHLDKKWALAQARHLEAKGPPGKPDEERNLLFGVPVAVKDNICVKEMPATCGSRILEGYRPVYNATVIERIMNRGAVVVGKTNMDEFAMGSSTENSAFKPTLNPWGKDLTPGGSSGGSAAAVAAHAVPLALGSDTGGSIRQPAAFCGIVGFKPTYGTVSRYGLIAFASSLDQIGPFSTNVRDTAMLFQAISGHDHRDSTSIPGPAPDVLSDIENGIEGLRVGIPSQYMDGKIEPTVLKEVLKTLDILKNLGALLVEIDLPHSEYAIPAYYLLATSEASSNLARYDGVRYGPRIDGKDFRASFKATRDNLFGPEVKRRIILGTFALSAGYYDAYYTKALKVRNLIRDDFQKAFQKVDLIAGPTTPAQAFGMGDKINDPLKMYLCDVLTTPASLSGIPGVSVPIGLTENGLPVGMQILGPPLGDALVLRAARALEINRKEKHFRSPVAERVEMRLNP